MRVCLCVFVSSYVAYFINTVLASSAVFSLAHSKDPVFEPHPNDDPNSKPVFIIQIQWIYRV